MNKLSTSTMASKQLTSAYFDPRQPGSFTAVSTFKRNHNTKKDPAEWLNQYPAYTLHKPTRQRFQRNRVVVGGIDHLWQLDLSDLSGIAKYNDKYRFLLFCIDVLSKHLWVVPLKTKTADSILEAFMYILKTSQRKPMAVQSDEGTEFVNHKFKALLRKLNINFYYTFNAESKASIVERVQRTMKGKMWRYFTHNHTYRYIDVLSDLVHSYNWSYHRSIKTKPALVNHSNAQDVWNTLYSDLNAVPPIAYKFNIGDRVRITTKRRTFQKGYESNWSEETFEITNRIPRHPPVYEVKDMMDEIIEGTFYEKELQKVSAAQDLFIVEKVLKTRKRKNHPKEYLVHWRGWPKKFDSWVTTLHNV